ncbi:MAG: SDR family oxidoreductase [Myxococcales bacterium]|nr:MAG: SDR family oxidoreductase [Myxococcales bacterium]
MDLGIRGRKAVVTAASKGLGLAVAERLAIEGAQVAICARNAETLADAVRHIKKAAADAVVFARACDVTKPEEMDAFVAATRKELGGIDILVTNAGGPPPGTFDSVSDAQWQEAFNLNLMSAVRLIRAALPDMIGNRWGRILLMASISARQPLANMILSNAVRAGVIGMAKTLADEVAHEGVLVNVLCPGFIRTGRMEQVIRAQAEKAGVGFEERLKTVQSQIPIGRLGRPEEFANVAAFLVSEAASFVTGSTVLADGGMFRGLM